MAHFAELNEDNVVVNVIVVDNIKCVNPDIVFETAPTIQSLKEVSGKTMTAMVMKAQEVGGGKVGKIGGITEQPIMVAVQEEVEWESEDSGLAHCQKLFPNKRFVQTSYNGNIRKNYAGKGYTYDEARDAFIPPQPYKSWVLNEDTCRWEAPTSYPEDGKYYVWNEEKQDWNLVEK